MTARGGGEPAEAQLAVGPPAFTLALSAVPAAPVKGVDRVSTVTLTVRAPDGTAPERLPPPVLRANVGRLGPVEQTGPGAFRAAYELPEDRHPELAIVVAFLPWPHPASAEGAFASTVLPLSSSVTLPGRTEPNAQIALEIANRTFGPVRSDERGNFELPIIAPPGHRFATSIAIDRAGNRRRKQIDLRLPPTDQLACVGNPRELPADGASELRILCVATDPYGKPLPHARLVAKVQALEGGPRAVTLRQVGQSGPASEWELIAPESTGKGCLPIEFTFPAGGDVSVERLCPALLSRAAVQGEVRLEISPVFTGAETSVSVAVQGPRGAPAQVEPKLRAVRGALG
ncbi:MAG: hypothetical protein ACK4N5_24985, partial [Myxococcales bacterium]